MNIKSYILGLSALSMVGLSACDTDNVRSIYENTTAGITFLADEQEESFSEKATDLSFNVDVVRQNSKGEAVINLISSCMKKNEKGKLEETTWNNDITVPSTVTFKDGETMTSFKVSLGNDIEQGMEHYVNVVLDTEEEPVDAYMSKLLTISRAYTYGQGTKVSIKDAKYWCQKALDAQVDGAKELMKVIKRKSFVHPFKNS